ncbi:MAG: hypothetical protein B7X40_00300 [Cellulomonas sp. 14-74-6]|nr:MAG: hypothetical protein B7X40_00300 [Cellulomonas sp. 14-74-6]
MPGALVPAVSSRHTPPSTNPICSIDRRTDRSPSTHSSRPVWSVSAATQPASGCSSSRRAVGMPAASGWDRRTAASSGSDRSTGALTRSGSMPMRALRRHESTTTRRTSRAGALPVLTNRSCASRSLEVGSAAVDRLVSVGDSNLVAAEDRLGSAPAARRATPPPRPRRRLGECRHTYGTRHRPGRQPRVTAAGR